MFTDFSKTCFKQKKSPDLSETCFRLVCNVSEMSKNRFRILRGSMQLQPPVVKDVVMACCTLHNFLRTKTENFVHEELDIPDEQMPPCGLSSIPLNAISHAVRGTGAKYNTAAKVVRDKLAEYFVWDKTRYLGSGSMQTYE